jgi:hypothetical protein
MRPSIILRRSLLALVSLLALAAAGLVPAVAPAPAAHAATSALSAPSPKDFGAIPVGRVTEADVQVTNTGASQLQLEVTGGVIVQSNAGGLFDFFAGPAVTPAPTSCVSVQGIAAPLAPHGSCTLGIYFLPTHFGLRATMMTIADSMGGTLTLTLSGAGDAGYYLAGSQAEFATFGLAVHDFESSGMALNRPVVGMAATPSGDGFWLDATDGGVFTFGDAGFFGSTGNIRLNQPVVGMAATPTGHGYWLVASDGGIFTFGDAGFFGSTGNIRLNQPIVGMAATPTGHGYWLVASDGGIFTFGDAGFFGSTGNIRLNQPVVGMAPTPSGDGYWLVASDGGIFTFGDAGFFGSTGNIRLNLPIVGMAASPTGQGYWLVASDGGIFTFNVPFEGSLGGLGIGDVIGMALTTAPLPPELLMAPATAAMSSSARTAGLLDEVQSGTIPLLRPTSVVHR